MDLPKSHEAKTGTEPDPDAPDPDAPVTAEEARAAAALRDALSDPARVHAGASFARALVLAHAPRGIGDDELEEIVRRALAGPRGSRASLPAVLVRGRRAPFLLTGAAGVLALVAAALVFSSSGKTAVVPAPAPPVAFAARTTQPLFHEPFAARGGASRRIDVIASARASDLRENLFARWDVP